MTDISIYTNPVQAEHLSWVLTPPDGGFDQNGTLSIAAFNATQHYPNGYIPSGTVLGRITATGLLGPYLDSALDGRQTAVGILKATVSAIAPNTNGQVKVKVGCAYRVHGMVSAAKLPLTSGTAALGGYIDAASKVDLPLIYFAA